MSLSPKKAPSMHLNMPVTATVQPQNVRIMHQLPSVKEFYETGLYLTPFIVRGGNSIGSNPSIIALKMFERALNQAQRQSCRVTGGYHNDLRLINIPKNEMLQNYLNNPCGQSCEIDFFSHTDSQGPFEGIHPDFFGYSFPRYDWSVGFMQVDGQELDQVVGVFNITSLHYDAPATGQWMRLLEGKKRFYLLPPDRRSYLTSRFGISDWARTSPVFISP